MNRNVNRRLRTKFVILLGFFLALAVNSPAFGVPSGTEAPDGILTTLAGEAFQLSSLRGQRLVLKIGTVWCPGCKRQTQEIEEITPTLAAENVTVVEVFLGDRPESIRKFFGAEHAGPEPLVLIGDDDFARAYGIFQIPRVLILNEDFTVRSDYLMVSSKTILESLRLE